MALPDSGQISISQLRTNFGGSTPDGLAEYYRGGSNVADNAAKHLFRSLGAISFSDFYSSAGSAHQEI